ncbi:filamentous hemagglutinin N-terminal domain-containing protein [Cyanobacteria bacterium FACHB-471]|nr:filamentous hemagglutinin N-terminal domain-containing protein [Cyanobacteria bacterium FACHB-471]
MWQVSKLQVNLCMARLSLGTLIMSGAFIPPSAEAQLELTPDTAGDRTTNTIVTPVSTEIDIIQGGARPADGINLFHSFEEFNVPADRGIYFEAPNGVENIFSRITGSDPSDLLGTVGVIDPALNFDDANLFLINPNGILFGPDAILNVQGSFVGTTADAIGFGDRGSFSATNPELPSELLTVNPSVFFFNQLTAAPIQSTARDLLIPGRSGIFLGGDIVLNNSNIAALRNRLELGGVAGRGTVGINSNNGIFRLNFPTNTARADVSLLNGSAIGLLVDGELVVNAHDLNLTNNSNIISGITPTPGFEAAQAGDITIHATGDITFSNRSGVASGVLGATGRSGNIQVTGQNLFLINGSIIGSLSAGRGDAGDVNVDIADTVSLSGRAPNNAASNITSVVGSDDEFVGIGNGGDVNIQARRVLLNDRASISSTNILAQGNAGNLRIRATDILRLTNLSRLETETSGRGSAGNILIESTDQVILSSGSRISTATNGTGNAGRINIQANDRVLLNGADSLGNRSIIFASVNPAANAFRTRRAGNITITVENGPLTLNNGTYIDSNVEAGAVGIGGNIFINAESLSLLNGSQIQSILREEDSASNTPGAQGRTGNIAITTRDVFAARGLDRNGFSSGVFTSVGTGTLGDAGNIRLQTGSIAFNAARITSETFGRGSGGNIGITANSITMLNGAQIGSSTYGRGDAGNINVDARGGRVTFDGRREGIFPSGIFSTVEQNAIGDGGTIEVTAGSLFITNRAQFSSSTSGRGNAGDITIYASDRVHFLNSIIISEVSNEGGVGSGGDIALTITDGSLELVNGSALLADTENQGNAGNITLDIGDTIILTGQGPSADDINIIVPNQISSAVDSSGTAIGDGGEIDITANRLLMTDEAFISSATFGRGDAGDLFITIDDIQLSLGSSITSSVGSRGIGDGGDIEVESRSITLTDGSQISAFVNRQQRNSQGNVIPAGQGSGGTLRIHASESITLTGTSNNGFSSGFSSLTERGASGRAGDIYIDTGELQIADGAIVVASTFNASPGGDIYIDANTLEVTGGAQVVTSARGGGNAGGIQLNITDSIQLSGFDANFGDRQQRVEQFIPTSEGQFEQVDDIITNEGANSGIFANTRSGSTGRGGQITANSTNLTLTDGATITARSDGSGFAGDIFITTSDRLRLNNSDIVTSALNSSGGDILINAIRENNGEVRLADRGIVTLEADSDITTNSSGDGGNIAIGGTGVIAFDDSDIISRSSEARGGDITLSTFFSETNPPGSAEDFDRNDQVDVNAAGALESGQIVTTDTTTVQNSLADLPDTSVNVNQLLANSCIVRSQESGTFLVTGTGGLPQRPGDTVMPSYPTGEVRSIPQETSDETVWQSGNPVVEPQNLYQLADGRVVLSRECE